MRVVQIVAALLALCSLATAQKLTKAQATKLLERNPVRETRLSTLLRWDKITQSQKPSATVKGVGIFFDAKVKKYFSAPRTGSLSRAPFFDLGRLAKR